ncbi:MAG: hypothetical protein LBF60_01155 [Treponema sp.]|jgi:hypothetical protein|nr:hypothetical protein [Treponema sp.]
MRLQCGLKSGCEKEYKKRRDEVWTELKADAKRIQADSARRAFRIIQCILIIMDVNSDESPVCDPLEEIHMD